MYDSYRAGSPGDPRGDYRPAGPGDGGGDYGNLTRKPTPAWVWMLVGLPVAAGLSWLATEVLDGWIYTIVAIGGAVILGLVLLGFISTTAKREASAPGPAAWGVFGCAVLLWGAWTVTGLLFLKTAVYVDNYSDHDVRLELDGKPWLELRAGEVGGGGGRKAGAEARLPRKAHVVTTIDAKTGKELDRRTIDVDSGPFIFNVLGAGAYLKGTAEYSTMPIMFGNGDRTETVSDVWIRARVDYLFEEPPSSISSESTSETRTYLKRLGRKADQQKEDQGGPPKGEGGPEGEP
jgi:hypothetical protein